MNRLATAAGLAALLALIVIACDSNAIQVVQVVRETPEQEQTVSGATEPRITQPAVGATRGPDDDELARRAARFDMTEFTASYVMSVEFAGGLIDGTLTWYQKPGKARGDFTGQVNGQEVDIVVIPGPGYPSEEFLYVCSRESRSCIESRPESEQNAYPNGEFPVVLGALLVGAEEFAEAVTVTETSERTVAGQEVICFKGQGVEGAPFDTGELCATEDGIALLVTEDAPDQTIALEARAFSRTMNDDIFELPYPLEDGS